MIIDYNKVRAAGYEVVELDPNVHIIKNFISDNDKEFLLDITKNIDEDEWSKEYRDNVKRKAMETFGTDDLDFLERGGLISQNTYMYDKSIALAYKFEDGPSKTVSDRSSDICSSLAIELRKFLCDGYELFPFNSMRRHYVGDGMVDHTDQKDTPEQRQSCVLYLNDDYSGGELYFRDQGIDVRPEAGSIAIFNNGIDYMHGVREVLPGPTRYTLATYITKLG